MGRGLCEYQQIPRITFNVEFFASKILPGISNVLVENLIEKWYETTYFQNCQEKPKQNCLNVGNICRNALAFLITV